MHINIYGGVPRQPGESHPSYRWFLGNESRRNPQKVNSLIYKDYTLVEYEDGSKSYVSPERKDQLLLEGKLHSTKATVQNEKVKHSSGDYESESDSGYEIPVEKGKQKSCTELDESPKGEMKRYSSFPFSGGDMSPGDNGRINLPPYLVPLETSLTLPMSKEKRKGKKNKKRRGTNAKDVEKGRGSSSPEEVDHEKRFSLADPFWRRSDDANESPEDAEVRQLTEEKESKPFPASRDESEWDDETEGPGNMAKYEARRRSKNEEEINSKEELETTEAVKEVPEMAELEQPVELFPENLYRRESESTKKFSRGSSLPRFSGETPRKERSSKRFEANPLKKMFGKRRSAKGEAEGELRPPKGLSSEEPLLPSAGGRYDDAIFTEIRSDTESADHGSADKSSVSKLTSEKQPKKLMSGLLGSFRKGRNKDKVADNDPPRNPSSFEISVKEQPEEADRPEVTRTEGIVYAELDMARSPGSVMRRDDEKTEYAEIIYPGSKLSVERTTDELRKSRENLSSSRENLTEVDEAFSTSPDGKKEAAV